MATNRDLLKEAIADAKAVKETAIANAKAALEEAFTPFLKEKLASKIAEMDEETNEELEITEENVTAEAEEKEASMKKESEDMAEEVSLDELLAELELDEYSETQPDRDMDGDGDVDADDVKMMKEAGDDEEMNIEDMSEDDLKSFIEDVIKDMVSAGELEAGESMEGEEEGGEEMEMDMEAGAEEEVDEDINIDELLAEVSEAKEEEMKEGQVDEYIEMATTPEAIAGIAAALGLPVAILLSVLKDSSKKAKLAKDVKDIASGKEETSEELAEAYSTIEELRNELNEINLLNAKLLYTNKIFRNKSLTETQKVHVLTSFDKATTKKEVELVYETLTESLKASATKAPIKESLGSASKVLGGATSKPIIENDAFSRMRELAFGNKK